MMEVMRDDTNGRNLLQDHLVVLEGLHAQRELNMCVDDSNLTRLQDHIVARANEMVGRRCAQRERLGVQWGPGVFSEGGSTVLAPEVDHVGRDIRDTSQLPERRGPQ
jgi:hypothetical protein